MIKTILELLAMDDWYGVSEEVDIAKGKYKACSNFADVKKTIKRNYYGSK